jgi:CheY-like chemotaxis protein
VSRKVILWTKTVSAKIESGRSRFLSRASLRAMVARNGSVLLEAASTESPDLIVLSDDLLGVSVADVYRTLKGNERTRSIPLLVLARPGNGAAPLRGKGDVEVLEIGTSAQILQETIALRLGLRLRRFTRYPVVLPVERGRFFREFLGYSNSVSEGGMGFDTLARIKGEEFLPLRIYRNTEEKPIAAVGRVRGVRPNIDTGIGYAVGVEFHKLSRGDRTRLMELFPRDRSVVWGPDPPAGSPPDDTGTGGPGTPGR